MAKSPSSRFCVAGFIDLSDALLSEDNKEEPKSGELIHNTKTW